MAMKHAHDGGSLGGVRRKDNGLGGGLGEGVPVALVDAEFVLFAEDAIGSADVAKFVNQVAGYRRGHVPMIFL